VADIKGLRVSGFPAWLLWLMIHIWYLIGVQNRIVVLVRWSVSFFTHGRGGRVIEEFDEADERATISVGRQ
jgi:NADH:ubiquinone reductase (H+-translocating)